jgi:hypothetical protein
VSDPITTKTYHADLSLSQNEQLLALRVEWKQLGYPSDHAYARSIALIEWDGVRIAVRQPDGSLKITDY